MAIKPKLLRQMRNEKRFSQKGLAKKAEISLRQIARLETDTESPANVRKDTLNKLADALEVQPGVLTGELPLPEPRAEASVRQGERIQVSALLEPDIRLAYALIQRRYGVTPTTLFNAAPLMFVLLAEGSFAWRQEKVDEARKAAEHLRSMSGHGDHLSFANAAYRAIDGADAEEQSIRRRDLFGDDVGMETLELGYNPSTNNPFADYLRDLVRKIDDPSIVDIDEATLAYSPALAKFPHHAICRGDLDEITCGNGNAAYALEAGHARVRDIPEELWAEDAAEARVQWLEQQIPERQRALREKRQRAFEENFRNLL